MSKRKELLFSVTKKDLEIQFFRAGGPGGQHQNKTDSACRIKHTESGAVGECRNHRSQDRNKSEAFSRMIKTETFQNWVKFKSACKQKDINDIDTWVEQQMDPRNLKIELVD